MRPRIVAGNWKLNGSRSFATELLDAVAAAPRAAGVELVVLPPVMTAAGVTVLFFLIGPLTEFLAPVFGVEL
jgi:triosephosphate isomerase